MKFRTAILIALVAGLAAGCVVVPHHHGGHRYHGYHGDYDNGHHGGWHRGRR